MDHHPRRLRVDRRRPEAAAVCDRCNCTTNLDRLGEQMEWRGDALYDTGLKVCSRCMDDPQPQFRRRRIDADPLPVDGPRPPRWIT